MQRQPFLALILVVSLLAGNARGALECLQSPEGFDYRSHVNTTRSGRTCQAWNVDEPHKPSVDCTVGLVDNYCRNMLYCQEATPWCYTTDPDKRWELCDIPTCERDTKVVMECLQSPEGYDYYGQMNTTKSGRTCQAWNVDKPHEPSVNCPVGLVGNYCRNKFYYACQETVPWCYTTDPNKRWEVCEIPKCAPIARGYREFGDCAVFFDHNRKTCEDVTSTTNALDFILRVGPFQSQNTFHINVTMQKGDCSDDKQLHVYTVTELSGGPFDGSFRRCHLGTTEPQVDGATVCTFTCRCTGRPCLYVTTRIFGNFGPVKSLCEIELD